jgi:hypothetical protein
MWKNNQSMHIRWNVTWLSDQYGGIDKLGDENLRRDYVTNFLDNACILLNLDCKTAPNTSNLVERYYFDWDGRIDDKATQGNLGVYQPIAVKQAE